MSVLTRTLDPEIPMDYEESVGPKSSIQGRKGSGPGSGSVSGVNGSDRVLVERARRGEARLKELRVQVRYMTSLFVCLFVFVSVCLSLSLSACLSASHYVCLHVCPSFCLSVCLSACMSVCLHVCLSVCLSVYLL